MMEWCTQNEGTNLNAYDMTMTILNAIHDAVDDTIRFNNYIARTIAIVVPGGKLDGWVIPLMFEGNNSVPVMNQKKFWGVRLSIKGDSWLGDYDWGVNIPFPRKSIDDLWEAFIAPYDIYAQGSEFWPYYDPAKEITDPEFPYSQGWTFDPPKKFGIFASLPTIITRGAIILTIIYVLQKAGLFKLASAIIDKIMIKMKQRKLQNAIDDVADDLEILKTATAENFFDIAARLKSIDTRLGVRLLLK